MRAPMFMTAARLSRLSKFDDEMMGRVLRAVRLVIDDLAVEYADEKGFFRSLLDEVINERYGNRLPTLITTNLAADLFKERCGERITDRVREAGRFVSLDNPSLRRRQ
jgi:DNA replication protein DnaC